jgi:predicted alpha/beta-fold hydrolase
MNLNNSKPKSTVIAEDVRSLLAEIGRLFAAKPFRPHPLFSNGHAQTLAAYAWPRRAPLRSRNQLDEERLFTVAPGIQVLAHCRWQTNRTEQPTMVLWHGIEGSSSAVYMLSTAEKAFRAGFNVMRMNVRNCGGTEHLTPTLYHGGLTEDLRVVVTELIEHDQLKRLFLVGFSLGGNMVLKLAGEFGSNPPPQISAICAISPSVDLHASADLIGERRNWIYHRRFVTSLQQRLNFKRKLYPDLYDSGAMPIKQTLREFDDRITAPAFGFDGVDDYYTRASALPLLADIRIPTLIIHAQDDPFIPFAPLRDPAVAANPYILLVAPEQGGHVAFVAAKTRTTSNADSNSETTNQPQSHRSEDRFWAENRVAEFCEKVDQLR